MQVWRHPVAQFLGVGIVVLAALAVGTTWLGQQAATQAAIADARSTTVILARSVAQPAVTNALLRGQAAAIDRFDRVVLHRLLVGQVRRIKLWDATGRVVYSDRTQLIGDRFALGPDELQILTHGGDAAEVSDLSKPENRFETRSQRLLEVYTRLHAPNGQPLLFEAYFSYDDVAHRSRQILAEFRPITLGGLLVFLALTTPLVWILARRLSRSARARERLLGAAVEASDAERRRIARDLHDGVVQNLAGTSFALSATARELAGTPELARKVEGLASGLRKNLRSLRSLLVEIYPPQLRTDGLATALDDLVAPAASAGVEVDLRVEDTSDVDLGAVALVWRVAQEAVRNALRHGAPSLLKIVVERRETCLRLVVADDGVGFDTTSTPAPGHFGLRGLRDLIEETDGRLSVASHPGIGTRVTLEVATR
jgi:two-component system, NarL family, sensor kinase